ncbi:MAG: hypothetical protein ACKOB4_16580 [Acidobacteriota bacterium]
MRLLIATNQAIEDHPALTDARASLLRSIDRLREEHTALLSQQRVLALDLIAGIRNGRKNSAEWLTSKSPDQRPYLKGNQAELEEFAAAAIRHGIAEKLLDELTGDRQRDAKLLRELVDKDKAEVTRRLNNLTDEELLRLCEGNEIKVSRHAKTGFNRTKTLANIERRISELREYIKLSRLE